LIVLDVADNIQLPAAVTWHESCSNISRNWEGCIMDAGIETETRVFWFVVSTPRKIGVIGDHPIFFRVLVKHLSFKHQTCSKNLEPSQETKHDKTIWSLSGLSPPFLSGHL
jgi:hypothetical protein